MNATTKFDAMGKEELRAACREAGVSYSKLNNDGMRQALLAVHRAEEAPAHNPWETKVPEITGAVTTVVNGHKIVSQPAKVEKPVAPVVPVAPKEATSVPRSSYKGYKIDKDRPMQNGVKRPSDSTVCGQIWAELEKDLTVSFTKFQEIGEARGWNKYTIGRQFYECRKFNGI